MIKTPRYSIAIITEASVSTLGDPTVGIMPTTMTVSDIGLDLSYLDRDDVRGAIDDIATALLGLGKAIYGEDEPVTVYIETNDPGLAWVASTANPLPYHHDPTDEETS